MADRRDRFRNPYERRRFNLVENLTDKQTSAMLQGLVEEGGVANVEHTLERAIQQLYRDATDKAPIWRYFCRSCVPEAGDVDGFVSGPCRTRAVLEDGLRRHCSVDGDHDVVVFTYDHTEVDWSPERIEEIAEAHRVDDDVHEAILAVADEHRPDVPGDDSAGGEVTTDA